MPRILSARERKLAEVIYDSFFYYKFHLNVPFDLASENNMYKEVAIDLSQDILRNFRPRKHRILKNHVKWLEE